MKTIEQYHEYLMNSVVRVENLGYMDIRDSLCDSIARVRRYADENGLEWKDWIKNAEDE